MQKSGQIEPIYMDNHLLVVNKPAGMLVQGDRTNDVSLLELCKRFLRTEFDKPGDAFLGPVHRLDRPTSGVIVFARTSKAAARLSAQMRNRGIQKKYIALVEGKLGQKGVLVDFIDRRGKTSRIAAPEQGKYSKLTFKRLAFNAGISLVDIDLQTGRHHQIRIQFAHRGFPVLGDQKYGAKRLFRERSIALHSYSLTLMHPVRKEPITFEATPDSFWNQYFGGAKL